MAVAPSHPAQMLNSYRDPDVQNDSDPSDGRGPLVQPVACALASYQKYLIYVWDNLILLS